MERIRRIICMERMLVTMKEVDWFDPSLIPGLLYFQNGGSFTGSVTDYENRETKEFRYKIDSVDGIIQAYVWYGPFCFEKSEIVEQAEFALTEEGRTEMLKWLKKEYESMIA